MEEFLNDSFGFKLSARRVAEEVVRFMEADEKRKYKITVGTDSQLLQGGQADFVSAVVAHRVGNGGRYFWRRLGLGKFHTLRDRLIKEVMLSLELSQKILEELEKLTAKLPQLDWSFEIHADVGANGESKNVIQEVAGMIRAYNFEFKTKPESYAASNIADRHV